MILLALENNVRATPTFLINRVMRRILKVPVRVCWFPVYACCNPLQSLQQAYTGNQHTRTGTFSIRLITRLIKKVGVARTLFSRANSITSNNEKKIEEFHQITKTLKNNGFPSNKCSFKNYMQNHNIRKTEKLKRFTSIPYVQGVS